MKAFKSVSVAASFLFFFLGNVACIRGFLVLPSINAHCGYSKPPYYACPSPKKHHCDHHQQILVGRREESYYCPCRSDSCRPYLKAKTKEEEEEEIVSSSYLRQRDEKWNNMYHCLLEYRKQYSNCLVPHGYSDDDGKNLGIWVKIQRDLYKKTMKKDGRGGGMRQDRQDLLDDIGFVWDLGDHKWNTMHEKLKSYHRENGDCNVPHKVDFSLYRWVYYQRKRFLKESLPSKRIHLLKAIDLNFFDWQSQTKGWSQRYEDLKLYRIEFGHCNVPKTLKDDTYGALGSWVSAQRVKFSKNGLSQDRIDLLNEIGFVWTLKYDDDLWLEKYEALKSYKEENGHCNVPVNTSTLGWWVGHQRVKHKKGRMRQDRIDLLDTLGFAWTIIDGMWLEKYDALKSYKEDNGHCNVPTHTSSLGYWVGQQRALYKKGRLLQDRIDRLNGIGFEWGRGSNSLWEERYDELKVFHNDNGHCNVPVRASPLGKWVSRQRTLYKKGCLERGRIDRLDEIGFDFRLRRSTKN